jgi:hypothetical protein
LPAVPLQNAMAPVSRSRRMTPPSAGDIVKRPAGESAGQPEAAAKQGRCEDVLHGAGLLHGDMVAFDNSN